MLHRVVAASLGYRRIIIVAVHAVLVAGSYALAYLLRWNFSVSPQAWTEYFLPTLPLLLFLRLLVFARFRLYSGLWRYVTARDLPPIFYAVSLSSLAFLAADLIIFGYGISRAVFALDWLLCLVAVTGARVAIRLYREEVGAPSAGAESKRTIIVGAGDAAENLLRSIDRSLHLAYDVVGIVDDDLGKQKVTIRGVPVIGTTVDLPRLCQSTEVDEILIAIPSLTQGDRHRILQRCREARVPVKTVPTLRDLFEGSSLAQLRDITPEDMLGREPVKVDAQRLSAEVVDRCALITGAGGSIGSELARQLATLGPRRLVLVDRAESPLHLVTRELGARHPELQVAPVVADITDDAHLGEIFAAERPDLVYHAAAYKHVALMEQQPLQAIVNNTFGTESVARLSAAHGVRKMVLVSTDKAVSPVGVMGMTKRLAECVLLAMVDAPTVFVSVRFGNVLGSNGSVLPIFKQQIAGGGPLTITDPQAARYFMLVSEAAQLVLQAAAMGRGGEVFFLDMGEPMEVKDLAEDLIRLSGRAPGRDLPVETIGLAPGERLQEVLLLESEHLLESDHEKIRVAAGGAFDRARFLRDLEELRERVAARDEVAAMRLVREMISRY